MQPSDFDAPRSIMDPVPPKRRAGFNKRIVFIILGVIVVLAILAGGAYVVFAMRGSSSTANQNTADQVPTQEPTPVVDDIETAPTKQVQVEGRTFTHIVPKTWKIAGSDGDLQIDTSIDGKTGPRDVAIAIRYNQGTYALNPAAPAGTYCDRIVADSEEVKVSPTEERYINYCGKKDTSGSEVFSYALFTKYSYKAGKVLSAAEQSDLIQNILLFGRVQPQDDKPYTETYETTKASEEFQDMIEILRSIEYVEVQG